jgi:hypothetical protein
MTQAYTERFTEVHRLGGVLWPDSYAIGDYYTAWSHVGNNQRAVFTVFVGDMVATSIVHAYILASTDGTLGTAMYIPGKVVGVWQALGGGQDAFAIEVRTEELDVDGGYCYLAGYVDVDTAAAELSAALYLGASNYVPVPTVAWTQIVD